MRRHRLPRAARHGLALAASAAFALALAAGCGGAPGGGDEAEEPAVEEGQLSRSAMLYFADADGKRLEGEKREVYPEDATREAVVRSLLRELAAGPARPGLHPVAPPALEVEGVFFDDTGGLFIGLSGASLESHRWGAASELAFIKSIVRTVGGGFPEVMRVTLLVDGEVVESIAGHVACLHPFEVAEWR